MKLLKIGRLDVPRWRWLGALRQFEQVTVFSAHGEEAPLPDCRFAYHTLEQGVNFRRVNTRLMAAARRNKGRPGMARAYLRLLQVINWRQLRRIARQSYDFVYSSYNDYDESAIYTLLLKPFLKRNVPLIRACKETRPEPNWFEGRCFDAADVVVLNHPKNLEYFALKHPQVAWGRKKVLTGLDEDCRAECVTREMPRSQKLSEKDGRLHAVILCGVAKSDQSDPRSGARQFYLPMIQRLIDAGCVVHLHTLRIEADRNGRDLYRELHDSMPARFLLEAPLDLDRVTPEAGYAVLSRYDVGVLHNFSRGSTVSHFDRVNIPNRFYEYQAAGVFPLVRRGTAEVVEDIIEKHQCGIIYDELQEVNHARIMGLKPLHASFEDYFEQLFGQHAAGTATVRLSPSDK